ncbi:hypothetical protein HDU93_003744 [Gonapodya sp. JEL0774]|nr:hypothetical protein HDU93_003744 [Gonapodya sp. JEL0774]
MSSGDFDNTATSWSREEEKALVRKLDLRLMPFAMAMFFVAYLEVLKYFTPRVWFTRIMFTWGVVSACQAACSNKTGLVICRLMVGVAEAGLLPGLLFWIGFWYRKFEIGTRTALIHSMLATASAFAGLIATGSKFSHIFDLNVLRNQFADFLFPGAPVGNMNGAGGLPTWRWIFIIEAFPSLILAVFTLIFLPDFPHTAHKFLSPREQQIAIARLPPSAPSHLQKNFDGNALVEALKDPMNFLYPVFFSVGVIPQLALQYFLVRVPEANPQLYLVASLTRNCILNEKPTILNAMGYTGATSNLMSAPPNLWGAFFEICMAVHSDATQERLFHILIPASIGLVGYALLPVAGKNAWPVGVRYLLTFLANSGIASAPAWYAWRQNMTVGATTVAFVMAWTNSVVNIAGAVSPFLFPTSDSPYYEKGGYVGAGCFAASMFGAVIIYFYDGYRRRQGFYDAIEAEAKRELDAMQAMFDKEAGLAKV